MIASDVPLKNLRKLSERVRPPLNEPLYIEGERHAVWTDGNEVRDVSFVDTGETRTLFVPDDKSFDGAPLKVRFAFSEPDRAVLAGWEAMMKMVPIQRMSPQDAWNRMPTYEQWLAGSSNTSGE